MTDLPTGWQEVRLEEVCEIVSSKRIFRDEYVKNGIPFFRSKEIIEKSKGNSISTELFISIEKFEELEKKYGIPEQGDILLTSVGTLGVPYLVRENEKFYFKDGNLTWFKQFKNIDSNFLCIWFGSSFGKSFFDSITIGSTQKALTISALKTGRITLPPLDEQKRIAKVLSALDDKIENNRQMNATLEAMAQTIFKAWFVDFLPVSELQRFNNGNSKYTSKAEIAKALYMDEATLDLFPSTFDENGLPLGWEVKKFENLIDKIKTGKRYDNKTSNEKGNIPVLDQGKSGIIGYHNDEAGVEASFDKPVATFANHTCYRRLIYYPFSTIQNIFVYYGKGVATTWLHYSSLDAIQFTEYKGHMPEFMSKTTIVPNNNLTEVFEKYALKLLHQIWNNEQENQTLTKMRDTLLPQLLSGKLRIADVENFIKD